MKKIISTFIFLALFLFLGMVQSAYAAMQVVYQGSIPQDQRDKFQTDLFTGSATYTYPLKVPKGTNDLTPSVNLIYNNMGAHDTSMQVGLGWQLDRDYIQRDVNFTPWDTADDKYKLHFQGALYDLVYNPTDSLFHTKVESHLKIQQFLSGGGGTTGMYWQVTKPDGTLYRFGYNPTSELICGGQTYDASWNVDNVVDTYGNTITYTYNQSTGVAYLSTIKYNADQTREIDFNYAASSYHKPVYVQGCAVDETQILSNAQVKVNGGLVRQYNLAYTQAADGRNLLQSVTETAPNGSTLPPTVFNYNGSSTGNGNGKDYTNGWNIDAELDHSDVQQCDMNGDGYPDLVKTTGDTGGGNYPWNVKLNNGSYFAQNWIQMGIIHAQLGTPMVRLQDVNGDGKCDVVQTVLRSGKNYDWFVWPNTSSVNSLSFGGQQKWEDNVNFDQANGLSDTSLALADMNGDGLPEIVHVGVNNDWAVYPNVPGQNTWDPNPPHQNWAHGVSSFNNPNIKLLDLNGDGFPDLIESNSQGGPMETYNVYINTGYSLLAPVRWIDNANVDAIDLSNHNVVMADVNGDGLPDIVKGNGFDSSNTSAHWQVLYNMGDHFSTTIQTWFDATMDGSHDFNYVKLADLNGDGQVDVLNQAFGKWNGYVASSNAPQMLSSVTNPQGGTVSFSYNPSTRYSNDTNLPFPLWLVQGMTVGNGVSGEQNTSQTTSYSYANGLYSFQNHEFRGFGQVTQTDPNGTVKIHTFAQDDGKKGRLLQVDTNDASANPYVKTVNTWSSDVVNNIYTVNLIKEQESTFDGTSTNPKVTERDYEYDTYGNLTKKSELGDIGITGDERFTHAVYTVNPAAWIVDTPSDVYLAKADDSTKISETWNYYDNHTNLTDAPTKGDVTKLVKWLQGGTNPTTLFVFDSHGNKTQVTDANNHITQTVYGTQDTTFTYPDKTVNAKNQSTSTVYDLATGNLLSKTDPNGSVTSYVYDAFGRITKEIKPGDTDTYPTASYQYFLDGIAPEGTLVSKRLTGGQAGTYDTYTFVDGLQRIIQTRVNAKDPSQQIVSDTYFDNMGNVSRQTVSHLDTNAADYVVPIQGLKNTSYVHDPVGRVTKITNPDGTTKTTSYSHRVRTIANENANVTKQYFNAYNKIEQVDEEDSGLSYSTFYAYDVLDNLIQILNPSNNQVGFTFDTLGRKVAQNDPDLGVWQYQYDAAGNMTKQIDAKNVSITKSYDELDRVTKVDYPTDTDTTFTYDTGKIGTLSSVTDGAGTVTYTYDNRLRKTQEQRVMDGTTWTTSYTYDSADRMVSQTNPDGEVVTYSFNPQGQINSVSGVLNNIDYNALNKTIKKDFVNNLSTVYTYDPNSFRLSRIQTGALQDLNYTYDGTGNVTSIIDAVHSKTQSYTYDSLERLKTAQQTNGYSYAFSYDILGNLLSAVKNGTTITYAYGQSAGIHALTSVSSGAPTVTPTPTPTPTGSFTPTPTPTPVLSVPKLVQKNGTIAYGTYNSVSLPSAVSAGNTIVVGITHKNGTVSSVTDNRGNTYTAATLARSANASSDYVELYYAKNVVSGLTSVKVSFGTTFVYSGVAAYEYSGLDTVAPLDKVTSATGRGTTPDGGLLTTTTDNEVYFAVGVNDLGSDIPVAGAGYKLENYNPSTSYERFFAEDRISPQGSYPTNFSVGSTSNWAVIGASFKPRASTGSTPTPTPTVTPTPTPTSTPSVTPTPIPSSTPTPTPKPTVTPTPTPTIAPTATPTPTPTPVGSKPDLVISNISISPAIPNLYSLFTIQATITNQGNAVANNALVYVTIYYDKATAPTTATSYDDLDTPSVNLAPGQSMTWTYNYAMVNTGSGAHNMWLYVDKSNRILEGNENNNTVGPFNFTVH